MKRNNATHSLVTQVMKWNNATHSLVTQVMKWNNATHSLVTQVMNKKYKQNNTGFYYKKLGL